MAEIYVRRPDGAIVAIDQADAQAASNAGYTSLPPEERAAARAEHTKALPQRDAVQKGLLEATPVEGINPETGLSQESGAMADVITSSATFGLAGDHSPYGQALTQKFEREHPGQNMAAQVIGQTPGMLLGGAAGAGLRGAATGAGLAARGGAFAADVGINAAVAGGQIEGEQARVAGEDFNITDAALAGVMTEALGRGGAWGASKAIGGARNLITRAASDTVKKDAARSITKDGWVGEYRTAQHAEKYTDELAELGGRDLDTLETATAEVSRQDKKRARITRAVVENPAAQHEINVQAVEGLQRLRGALADELAEAPGGPAKRLAKHLDARITELETTPKGRKLWRILDENRQALQEYRQDLHQAYDSNPGSAWLSRDGLAAIDAAEESTRNVLLREDAWGEAAARMQREYNVPFHEKWFPARQTVLKDLHFATGKNAEGFTTYRGEPGKVRKFLAGLGEAGENSHRLREQFTQYLDGAEAIARAGEKDSPKAARDALESVRRLRKNLANAEAINAAARRTSERGAIASAGLTVAGAAVGGAIGGAGGAVLGGAAVRGAKLGTWFGQVAHRFKVFHGTAESMAELLAKDALAPAKDAAAEVSERLSGDILDAPFPMADSLRPPPEAGPLAGQPQRAVGVAAPPEAPAGVFPGPGQVGRQETPRRPAGMEAITPQSVRGVGPEAPPAPPRRGGGGFTPMERPESLRASEHVGSSSEAPSIHEGAEVPMPGEALADTHPAPYRTEGMAYFEGHVQPGEAARSAEAKRMQALTEGEFAHVVDGLNATGQKAPDGSLLGDFLRSHGDELKSAGLIIGGTAAGAAAEYSQDHKSGYAGAAAGGLAALGLSGRLGKALLLGARFEATEAGKVEAKNIVRNAIEHLPPPPEQTTRHYYGSLVGDVGDASGKLPGVKKLFEVTRAASRKLEPAEQDAISDWVGSSSRIKHEQRTGLTLEFYKGERQAEVFESAMDKLTVMNPTKHGDLYRYVDLEDSGLADLLTKDEFKAGSHLSTSYYPDTDFGPHELRFTKVDAAGALIGVNPAEMEMVIPPDARFKVTGRYANPETGNFTFVLQEIPETRAGGLKDVGYLALPAAGAAALGADESKPGEGEPATAGGVVMGFLGAAALFKQSRGRLVADVARRLFSPTVGRLVARVVARQVYTRADMAKRQQEFQSWQENPQELVDRVAEGFRDVPPEHQAQTHAGVFRAAAFLREKLPSSTKPNAISMRDIPMSAEQMTKYARYEDAALRPADAWADAAARGHLSPELLETTEALHPDLLAEIRVAAYLAVREEGSPVSVQAKLQYAKLFDNEGSFADPSMSREVASMSALAFEQAVPPKPGGGPAGTSGGVSHIAAANSAPAGLVRLA